MSMLGGRLALIGDSYRKTTSDLLVLRPASATTGFRRWGRNVGDIENSGVELQLSATPIQAPVPGGLDWRTDFHVSHNRNRVTKLYGGQPFNSGIDGMNRVEVGQPLGAFHLVRFDGVDPATG